MPELEQRLGKDILVLGREFSCLLDHAGFSSDRDAIDLLFLEEETIQALLDHEISAGSALIASDSYLLSLARLARFRYEKSQSLLFKSVAESFKGRHVSHPLFELVSCDVPLDTQSKQSVREVFDQYKGATRVMLAHDVYDAISLVRFTSADDLRCALMAIRSLTAKPVIASIDLTALIQKHPCTLPDYYKLKEDPLAKDQRLLLEDCARVAQEFEASVFGVSLPLVATAQHKEVLDFLTAHCSLPLLICFDLFETIDAHLPAVKSCLTEQQSPECMLQAALRACSRGVQFVRPGKHSSLAHAALLAHFVQGQEVRGSRSSND